LQLLSGDSSSIADRLPIARACRLKHREGRTCVTMSGPFRTGGVRAAAADFSLTFVGTSVLKSGQIDTYWYFYTVVLKFQMGEHGDSMKNAERTAIDHLMELVRRRSSKPTLMTSRLSTTKSALTGVPCWPNFVRMSPPERLSKSILPKKPSGALSEESRPAV
jgi:hypothetical protein